MSIPVALQIYSVRDDFANDWERTLREVKSFGYDGIELAGLAAERAASIKQVCAEIGLVPISAHVSLQELLERPEETLALYKELGCRYVAVPYVGEARRPGSPSFFKFVGELAALGLKAQRAGLQLLYHNHDFEFRKIEGMNGLDVLYSCIPSELLLAELDTCWINVSGENPAEYVRSYTGRAPLVHLKDFYRESVSRDEDKAGESEVQSVFEFRPLGHGIQDLPSLLDACVDAGSKWIVVEQDQPSMGLSPMECARLSREYLRSLGW